MSKYKAKHTPGPWHVDLESEFTLGGDSTSVEAITPDGKLVRREVCNLLLSTDDHPDGPEWLEDAANARLIAASPDLLAACDALTARLASFVALHPGQADASDYAALDAGEAAIDKATAPVTEAPANG